MTPGAVAVVACVLAGWIVVAAILGAEQLHKLRMQADLDDHAADAVELTDMCTDPDCWCSLDTPPSLADVLLAQRYWPADRPLP